MGLAEECEEDQGKEDSGVHGGCHRWSPDLLVPVEAWGLQASLRKSSQHGSGGSRFTPGDYDDSSRLPSCGNPATP